MRYRFWILAVTTALLASGPGCFVVDELDSGMEQRKATSPNARKRAGAGPESPPQPGATRPDGDPVADARVALRKWWKHARTPTSGPKDPARATAIVSCHVAGQTRFMSRTECEVQGGTF